jgi:GNAT superfamily N-acetyltransferase
MPAPMQDRGHRLAAYRQCSADLRLESGRRGRMEYRYGNELDLNQVTELYRASTLGERRPIDDPAIVRSMLEHANLVVTAWDGEIMVGLARTLTDFSYVGYLSDLAVRESYQRQGIGQALIQKTRERMGPRSMLVLLAAPKAVDYYPRIGFKRHESAWVLRASERLGTTEESGRRTRR